MAARMFRPQDTEVDKRRKVTLAVAIAVNFLLTLGISGTLLGHDGDSEGTGLVQVWGFGGLVLSFCGGIQLFAFRSLTVRALSVYVAIYVLLTCLCDIHRMAALRTRVFPTMIIWTDVMLVTRQPTGVTIALVCSMVIYTGIIESERALRFGLFDIWGTPTREARVASSMCEDPPCPLEVGRAVANFFGISFVYLCDFAITRGFASVVLSEEEKMRAAIKASKQIATALAHFNLAQAEASLEAMQTPLPEELTDAYRQLLGHLWAYRAYLPAACVKGSRSKLDDVVEAVPGGDAWNESFDDHVASPRCDERVAPGAGPQGTLVRARLISHSPSLDLAMRAVHTTLLRVSMPRSDVDRVLLPEFRTLHTAFVDRVLAAASPAGGVVDALTADSIVVSYNISSRCNSHALSAVETVSKLQEGSWGGSSSSLCGIDARAATSCGQIVTGRVAVGVLGTTALRRHVTVGPLTHELQQLGTVGRLTSRGWLCSARTYSDIYLVFEARALLDRVALASQYLNDGRCADVAPAPLALSRPHTVLYELLMYEGRQNGGASTVASEGADASGRVESGVRRLLGSIGNDSEWMYALARRDPPWEIYNEAAALYLRDGCDADTAAAYCTTHGARPWTIDALRHAIAASMCIDLRPRCSAPQPGTSSPEASPCHRQPSLQLTRVTSFT